MTPESKEIIEKEEKELKVDLKALVKEEMEKELKNLKSIEIGDEEINGDKAVVEVKMTNKKGKTETQKMNFVKENDIWKIYEK